MALEQALAQDLHGEQAAALAVRIEQEQAALVGALQAVLPVLEETYVNNASVTDWRRVHEATHQLMRLLADDDLDARDAFRRDAHLLSALLGEQIDRLSNQIDAFAYEPALETLRRAVSACVPLQRLGRDR